jgi:hypothetical protein
MLHVPYRGDPPALTDLLGGLVRVYFGPGTIAFIRAGKLRALAMAPATPRADAAGSPDHRRFPPESRPAAKPVENVRAVTWRALPYRDAIIPEATGMLLGRWSGWPRW